MIFFGCVKFSFIIFPFSLLHCVMRDMRWCSFKHYFSIHSYKFKQQCIRAKSTTQRFEVRRKSSNVVDDDDGVTYNRRANKNRVMKDYFFFAPFLYTILFFILFHVSLCFIILNGITIFMWYWRDFFFLLLLCWAGFCVVYNTSIQMVWWKCKQNFLRMRWKYIQKPTHNNMYRPYG